MTGRRIVKRVFDIFTAIVGLAVLSPILCALSLVVLVALGRPILFRQPRAGLGGKPFSIVKFRTMLPVGLDVKGDALTDAMRLTRTGRFLRHTTLDELPELWNVLKGDMSLVGPRPLHAKYVPLYNARQRHRLEVRPGLTGWAVVKGRNALPWEERFELDVWYVENQSFWLDLKILALTVGKVLRREGVSAEGHATMPEFEGSTK